MAGLGDTRKIGVWIGWTLVAVGAALVGTSLATRALLAAERERGLEAFEQAQRQWAGAAETGGAAVAASSVRAADGNLPEGDLPEGVLRIPALQLRVPVYTGTDERSLGRGAGRIDWTPPLGSDGNVGIAAHRDTAFAVLRKVSIGDEVLVDWRGGTLRYEVVETQIVEPTDVHVLDPTAEPRVTLVTCYPFDFVGAAPLRFIVVAELSDDGPAARARS